MKRLIGWAGVCGALGVLIGAFGAHAVPDFLASKGLSDDLIARRLDQFDVGVRYHLVHVAAMLGIAILDTVPVPGLSQRWVRWSFALMAAGIILFSGSLYVLVATNTSWLGAITPLGGTCWIIAWSMLAIGGFAPKRREQGSDGG